MSVLILMNFVTIVYLAIELIPSAFTSRSIRIGEKLNNHETFFFMRDFTNDMQSLGVNPYTRDK